MGNWYQYVSAHMHTGKWGHAEGSEVISDQKIDNDENSNFTQLMKKDAKYDPILQDWLEKKTEKYTSHSIQNEIIKIMADRLSQILVNQIKNVDFYGIMGDECTDSSNKEQLSFCVRL